MPATKRAVTAVDILNIGTNMVHINWGWAGYVDILAGASSGSNRHLAILGAIEERAPSARWVPLGVQALAVKWTEVAHLAISVVDNAIATAGYPSHVTVTSRGVWRLKSACI
jgi:hypothetical protein